MLYAVSMAAGNDRPEFKWLPWGILGLGTMSSITEYSCFLEEGIAVCERIQVISLTVN